MTKNGLDQTVVRTTEVHNRAFRLSVAGAETMLVPSPSAKVVSTQELLNSFEAICDVLRNAIAYSRSASGHVRGGDAAVSMP